MRARIERDLLVPSKAFIGKDGHIVQIAEGRHGSSLAVWKPLFELFLRSKCNILCAGSRSQLRQIYVQRGGKKGHGQRPVNLDDHSFGQLFARYVSERRDSLSRVCDRVGNDDIFNMVAVEEFLEFLDGHGRTPLPRSKSYIDPTALARWQVSPRFLGI